MSQAPYVGLRPFDYPGETDIFFGRDPQVDRILERLQRSRFLAVVGSSGCGKSSLVRAGLLAALERGFMAQAGSKWRVALLRPGDQPMTHLANALVKGGACGASPDADASAFLRATLTRGPLGLLEAIRESPLPAKTNLLLLVDQFEEIFRFRHEKNSNEAAAFVALLLASAASADAPVYVVLTMRSEFIGDCSVFLGLPEAINDGQFLTPRLLREELREVIVGPAEVYGCTIEPLLVTRLLNDVGDTDPDQLPLLEHVLLRMWRTVAETASGGISTASSDMSTFSIRRPSTGIALTVRDYEQVGGLKEALSKHLDRAFDGLDPRGQRTAEVLFRSLTERGRYGRDTRRPCTAAEVAEIAGVDVAEVARVVDAFRGEGRSFLTPRHGPLLDQTTIDISHEALISNWKRLNRWAEQESRSARTYHYLEDTARLWSERKAALWGTPNLEMALDWRTTEHPNPAWAKRYGSDFDLAMRFLDESEAQRTRLESEQEAGRKREIDRLHEDATRRRRTTKNLAGLAFLLLIVAGVAGFAFWRESLARSRASQSEARAWVLGRRNLSQALVQRSWNQIASRQNQGQGALLARQAFLVSHGLKQAARQKFPPTTLADGDLEELTGCIGTEVGLRELLARILSARYVSHALPAQQVVRSVVFSPDRHWLAAAGDDDLIRLWDMDKRVEVPSPCHESGVYAIAFSPDGHWLASGGRDGTIRIWRPGESIPVGRLVHRDASVSTSTGAPYPIRSLVWRTGSKNALISGGPQGTLEVWDLPDAIDPATLDGVQSRSQEVGSKGIVRTLVLSADGCLLASGTTTGELRISILTELEDSLRLEPVPMDRGGGKKIAGPLLSAAFSSDGRWLAATGAAAIEPDSPPPDSTEKQEGLALWKLDPEACLGTAAPEQACLTLSRSIPYRQPINSVGFGLEEKLIAGTASGKVLIWERNPGNSPVTGDAWAASPQEIGGHKGEVTLACRPSAGPSDPGWDLASAAWDGTVRLWKERRPDSIAQDLMRNVRTIEFIPGQPARIAVGDTDGMVSVVTFEEGRTRTELTLGPYETATGQRQVRAIASSPDGTLLAWASSDGTARLAKLPSQTSGASFPDPVKVDGETGSSEVPTRLFPPGKFGIWAVVFAPEKAGTARRWLATGGYDKQVRLFGLSDSAPPNPLGELRADGAVRSVVFNSDASMLAVATANGRVSVFELSQSDSGKVIGKRRSLRFRTTDGELTDENQCYQCLFSSVAFRPNTSILAAASWDGRVRLWDLSRRDCSAVSLDAHQWRVGGIAFSPDGELLAAGLGYGQTAVWHLPPEIASADDASCREQALEEEPTIMPFDPQDTSPISSVAFSADGKWLAAGGDSGKLRIWRTTLADASITRLAERVCDATWRNLTREEWRANVGLEGDVPYEETCSSSEPLLAALH